MATITEHQAPTRAFQDALRQLNATDGTAPTCAEVCALIEDMNRAADAIRQRTPETTDEAAELIEYAVGEIKAGCFVAADWLEGEARGIIAALRCGTPDPTVATRLRDFIWASENAAHVFKRKHGFWMDRGEIEMLRNALASLTRPRAVA